MLPLKRFVNYETKNEQTVKYFGAFLLVSFAKRNLVGRTNSVSLNVSFVTHHSNYELCTLALSEVCAPRNSPGSMLSSSSKNRWNRNVTGRVVFS